MNYLRSLVAKAKSLVTFLRSLVAEVSSRADRTNMTSKISIAPNITIATSTSFEKISSIAASSSTADI